jgi:hypothetical protein
MQFQFIGQNVHFAVSLLASLAVFAVFWLTFDAWLERRRLREAVKWSGFLLLALGLLLNGAIVESGNISASLWSAHSWLYRDSSRSNFGSANVATKLRITSKGR